MATEIRSNVRTESNAAPLRELTLARLRTPQATWEGEVVPAGTTGTVVEVLGEGLEYVLDFVEPFDAVATVKAEQLENVDEA